MASQQPLTEGFLGSGRLEGTVTSSEVKERYDNIIKMYQDKGEYRGLVLSNRMKVLLVSDPDTNNSAAAMDVNVGHLSDPEELPGLAHFCEHMLFMGTEKYPKENYYNLLLSEYGGAANAATFSDHTTFYFNIVSDHLGELLDIFAQFFKSPLFTESATSRELNAVNSEHENNISSDLWRQNQLRKSTSDPKHPFHKFGTGSRDTLETIPKEKGIDVRKELLKFHQKWYSSNIMSLVIYGKESLDELEAMAVQMFSDSEDRSVTAPSWPDHPVTPELRRKRIYCMPVMDLQTLLIEFPIPDVRQYYKSGPNNYLGHLVGHEGPGSVVLALKARGWCTGLMGAVETGARGFGFFTVQMTLTEDGLDHIDDIITLVFQYINMLRKEGPQRWVWEELRDLIAMAYRFKESEDPVSVVGGKANLLQDFPMEDILTGPYLMTEWRPELIEEILSLLTPENVRVIITTKYFSEKCTQTERWYGTKYLQEDIDDSLIQKWKSIQPIPELHLPPPNKFIPSNFELETSEDPTGDAIAPAIIKDTPLLRLWYKMDNEFLLPKVTISIHLTSPIMYSDPLSSNLTSVWMLLLVDSLQQSTYEATLAGLAWSISKSKHGLAIMINGYDDKQHILLEKIVDKIVNFDVDSQSFENMKENYIGTIMNMDAEQPHTQAMLMESNCLSELAWIKSQLLESTEDITVQQLVDFMPRMFKNVHIECLMYGNLTRERAFQIADILENRILKDATPLYPQELLLYREVEIDRGAWYLCEIQNTVHKSTCASVYYACGTRDPRQNVALQLLHNVISEPCFNVLRTKEQLGYIAMSSVRISNGVQGLRVLVQSDRHAPAYVEERIEAFIDYFLGYLENMSEEEFLKHREALVAQRLEKPEQMTSNSTIIWSEIISQEYNFDRARVEADQLNTITKEELILFYKRHISVSSDERRKLSVHVFSTAEGGVGREEGNDTSGSREEHVKMPTKITNLTEFKARNRLYPLPTPFDDIPPKGIPCTF